MAASNGALAHLWRGLLEADCMDKVSFHKVKSIAVRAQAVMSRQLAGARRGLATSCSKQVSPCEAEKR
eukprot:2003959-Amphidinium_carterae.3